MPGTPSSGSTDVQSTKILKKRTEITDTCRHGLSQCTVITGMTTAEKQLLDPTSTLVGVAKEIAQGFKDIQLFADSQDLSVLSQQHTNAMSWMRVLNNMRAGIYHAAKPQGEAPYDPDFETLAQRNDWKGVIMHVSQGTKVWSDTEKPEKRKIWEGFKGRWEDAEKASSLPLADEDSMQK